MTIDLTEKDHRALDQSLDTILKAYAAGEDSLPAARYALAHIITAACIENEGEVRSWLKPEILQNWKAHASRAAGTTGKGSFLGASATDRV